MRAASERQPTSPNFDVKALYAAATICDMTLPWEADLLENRKTVLPRYQQQGFTFLSLTMASDRSRFADTIHYIASETRRFLAQPESYILVSKTEDILRAKREHKVALAFHFQGTNPLEGDVNMVSLYHRLGIRHMLMAYNQKNFVGDGCSERTDSGLSRVGVDIVREMNRVGMLVDCSHTGYRTSMDVFEVSQAPVIFSHSNARAVQNHDRNIRDDQIIACAKSGGVIGMNGVGIFISGGDANPDQLLRHIDYIAELVGPRHIGLGIDLVYYENSMYERYFASPNAYPQGYPPPPWKFFQPEQLPELAEVLAHHGYSETEIRGILGENWLRVMRQVWG